MVSREQNDHDTIFASSSQFKSATAIRITGKKAKKLPKIFDFRQNPGFFL